MRQLWSVAQEEKGLGECFECVSVQCQEGQQWVGRRSGDRKSMKKTCREEKNKVGKVVVLNFTLASGNISHWLRSPFVIIQVLL